MPGPQLDVVDAAKLGSALNHATPDATLLEMAPPTSINAEPNLPDMAEDRILSIGIYGETVAAYRYTVLSEKLPGEEDRKLFATIAEEELAHKQRLQELLDKLYPGSSFYLSDEDKALVVSGPRLIDVRSEPDYRKVMQMALDTERRVAQFYQELSTRAKTPDVQATFHELALEGFQHHGRLLKLARERNLLPER